MEEEKKKGKGIKVFLIIFILLFLIAAGCLGYGYTKYDRVQKNYLNSQKELKSLKKDLDESKKEVEEIKLNIESLKKENETLKEKNSSTNAVSSKYEYSLKNVKCSTTNNSKCTKTVDVVYGGNSHKITIELTKNDKYNIYIDNKKVDSNLSGYEYNDFDGMIYVFNNKYLGILRAIHVGDYGSSGYNLTLYNNGSRKEKELVVKVQGQSICYDANCKREVDYYSFDGNTLKYWKENCNKKANIRYSLAFDGNKVTETQIDKTNGLYGGGASGC